jgi:hypothetical protein
LGLEQKSGRWVPKLPSDDQNQQHVEICSEFVVAVHSNSLAMLDSIMSMDKTKVYHTPEMKK